MSWGGREVASLVSSGELRVCGSSSGCPSWLGNWIRASAIHDYAGHVFFCQWNNEIYYASVVSVNNSVSQSMMLNSITVITRNGICVAEQTGPAWRISIQRHFHPWKLTCIREEPVDSSGVGNTAVFSIFSKAAANTANGGNSTWGWLDQNSWKSDLEGKHTVYWTHPPQKRMHSSHPRVICQVLRRFAKIMKLKSQCKNTAAGRNQITQCLGQILSISALVKPNHCRVPARTDPQKLKTQSHDKDDNMKKKPYLIIIAISSYPQQIKSLTKILIQTPNHIKSTTSSMSSTIFNLFHVTSPVPPRSRLYPLPTQLQQRPLRPHWRSPRHPGCPGHAGIWLVQDDAHHSLYSIWIYAYINIYIYVFSEYDNYSLYWYNSF